MVQQHNDLISVDVCKKVLSFVDNAIGEANHLNIERTLLQGVKEDVNGLLSSLRVGLPEEPEEDQDERAMSNDIMELRRYITDLKQQIWVNSKDIDAQQTAYGLLFWKYNRKDQIITHIRQTLYKEVCKLKDLLAQRSGGSQEPPFDLFNLLNWMDLELEQQSYHQSQMVDFMTTQLNDEKKTSEDRYRSKLQEKDKALLQQELEMRKLIDSQGEGKVVISQLLQDKTHLSGQLDSLKVKMSQEIEDEVMLRSKEAVDQVRLELTGQIVSLHQQLTQSNLELKLREDEIQELKLTVTAKNLHSTYMGKKQVVSSKVLNHLLMENETFIQDLKDEYTHEIQSLTAAFQASNEMRNELSRELAKTSQHTNRNKYDAELASAIYDREKAAHQETLRRLVDANQEIGRLTTRIERDPTKAKMELLSMELDRLNMQCEMVDTKLASSTKGETEATTLLADASTKLKEAKYELDIKRDELDRLKSKLTFAARLARQHQQMSNGLAKDVAELTVQRSALIAQKELTTQRLEQLTQKAEQELQLVQSAKQDDKTKLQNQLKQLLDEHKKSLTATHEQTVTNNLNNEQKRMTMESLPPPGSPKSVTHDPTGVDSSTQTIEMSYVMDMMDDDAFLDDLMLAASSKGGSRSSSVAVVGTVAGSTYVSSHTHHTTIQHAISGTAKYEDISRPQPDSASVSASSSSHRASTPQPTSVKDDMVQTEDHPRASTAPLVDTGALDKDQLQMLNDQLKNRLHVLERLVGADLEVIGPSKLIEDTTDNQEPLTEPPTSSSSAQSPQPPPPGAVDVEDDEEDINTLWGKYLHLCTRINAVTDMIPTANMQYHQELFSSMAYNRDNRDSKINNHKPTATDGSSDPHNNTGVSRVSRGTSVTPPPGGPQSLLEEQPVHISEGDPPRGQSSADTLNPPVYHVSATIGRGPARVTKIIPTSYASLFTSGALHNVRNKPPRHSGITHCDANLQTDPQHLEAQLHYEQTVAKMIGLQFDQEVQVDLSDLGIIPYQPQTDRQQPPAGTQPSSSRPQIEVGRVIPVGSRTRGASAPSALAMSTSQQHKPPSSKMEDPQPATSSPHHVLTAQKTLYDQLQEENKQWEEKWKNKEKNYQQLPVFQRLFQRSDMMVEKIAVLSSRLKRLRAFELEHRFWTKLRADAILTEPPPLPNSMKKHTPSISGDSSPQHSPRARAWSPTSAPVDCKKDPKWTSHVDHSMMSTVPPLATPAGQSMFHDYDIPPRPQSQSRSRPPTRTHTESSTSNLIVTPPPHGTTPSPSMSPTPPPLHNATRGGGGGGGATPPSTETYPVHTIPTANNNNSSNPPSRPNTRLSSPMPMSSATPSDVGSVGYNCSSDGSPTPPPTTGGGGSGSGGVQNVEGQSVTLYGDGTSHHHRSSSSDVYHHHKATPTVCSRLSRTTSRSPSGRGPQRGTPPPPQGGGTGLLMYDEVYQHLQQQTQQSIPITDFNMPQTINYYGEAMSSSSASGKSTTPRRRKRHHMTEKEREQELSNQLAQQSLEYQIHEAAIVRSDRIERNLLNTQMESYYANNEVTLEDLWARQKNQHEPPKGSQGHHQTDTKRVRRTTPRKHTPPKERVGHSETLLQWERQVGAAHTMRPSFPPKKKKMARGQATAANNDPTISFTAYSHH